MGNIDKFNDKDSFLKNFESLRPDLFFPENWSDEEKSKAVDIVRPQKTRTSMFSSIPMNCESIKCIFASTCPLLKENLAPKGKPCPLEMSMVAQFTSEYMDQLDVHEENLVEVSMIRDLVDQEVQYLRKTKLLLEDRLHKRRKDLRNQLLATREAKAKAGQMQADSAQAISDILHKVQAVQIEKEKLLKKKLGTYEVDDYIEAQTIKELEAPPNGDNQ